MIGYQSKDKTSHGKIADMNVVSSYGAQSTLALSGCSTTAYSMEPTETKDICVRTLPDACAIKSRQR
ncbi:hypothetical protein CLAFUR4_11610 [Fulvia fulva]|nr:hypothetical protein CLAFUR4_11610 [Fulvia fulva]